MKKRSVMRSVTFTLICLLLGIVIALQLKSINSNMNTALAENLRVDDLQQELVGIMDTNSGLIERIDQLNDALRLAESETSGQDEQINRIINERDSAELFAGLLDVSGPGGTITLISDPDFWIENSDLRLIANFLRASGAQAISINGERLVAMSEIVKAGSYIVINGKYHADNGQFEIKVIIEPGELENSMNLLQGALNSMKLLRGVDTTYVTMESVQIDRLREDSPAYRKDLLTPN